ncbi:MAG: plasmid pRiA4b ORF-3 family protein [Pseudonocardiaceae bacterium]
MAVRSTVYTIKVSLQRMKPPVWRRLLVHSDTSLAELHYIIQNAMGWQDAHLHQFEVDGTYYADTMHMLDDTKDESRMTLARLRLRTGDRFLYWYDFGDDWYHEIRVESVDRDDPSVVYPRCVAGRRACPPEDCGGPMGFDELMRALDDENHPGYQVYSEWMEMIGEIDYDPKRFDLAEINEVLEKGATGA